MTPAELHGLMANLAIRHPIFANEAEFQLHLAIELNSKGYRALLERPRKIRCNGAQLEIWVDIIAIKNQIQTAIELKFITKRTTIIHEGETFDLQNNWGTNLSRFDILKDWQRVAGLIFSRQVDHGYAVTISNATDAWSVDVTGTGNMGSAFSTHNFRQLRTGQILDWHGNPDRGSVGVGRLPPNAPIVASNNEILEWHNFSSFDVPEGNFRYLIIEAKGGAGDHTQGATPESIGHKPLAPIAGQSKKAVDVPTSGEATVADWNQRKIRTVFHLQSYQISKSAEGKIAEILGIELNPKGHIPRDAKVAVSLDGEKPIKCRANGYSSITSRDPLFRGWFSSKAVGSVFYEGVDRDATLHLRTLI
jgi:hypothetical protein